MRIYIRKTVSSRSTLSIPAIWLHNFGWPCFLLGIICLDETGTITLTYPILKAGVIHAYGLYTENFQNRKENIKSITSMRLIDLLFCIYLFLSWLAICHCLSSSDTIWYRIGIMNKWIMSLMINIINFVSWFCFVYCKNEVAIVSYSLSVKIWFLMSLGWTPLDIVL